MTEPAAMDPAWIGLGSNLDSPVAQLSAAVRGLAQLPESRLIRVSGFYQTPPWGERDQPTFMNAVVELETGLSAPQMLAGLLAMERCAGRQRDGRRWGPRRIDLDLLLLGQEIHDGDPVVPHPRLHERAFVLVPLAELDPEIDVPGQGLVKDLLNTVSLEGIERVSLTHPAS